MELLNFANFFSENTGYVRSKNNLKCCRILVNLSVRYSNEIRFLNLSTLNIQNSLSYFLFVITSVNFERGLLIKKHKIP